jgi:hypothetical protein
VVNDGSQPPTQANIKNVVEIKFPPQTPDDEQTADYARIAGSKSKVAVLGPGNCDCSQDDDSENPVKSAVSDTLSELGKALEKLSNSRPQLPGFGGLPLPPAPLPVP